MLQIRLAFVVLAMVTAHAMAQTPATPSSLLGKLVAAAPGATLSDGRGPLDRAAAKGDGPLAPAGLIVSAPMVLIGARSLQAQDAGELVAWMKAKGRAVRVSHGGAWSASLECALQLQDMLETKLTLVAAADAADALVKLKTGAVDVMCEAVPSVIEDVRTGEVLAYVLASDERLPALWDVATADQAGLPLFSATAWLGLYAPTRDAVAAVQKALTDEVAQKLADLGWIPFAATYQTHTAHLQQLASDAERRQGRLTDTGQPAAP